MKVTVRPDGEVVFDTEDVGQALQMIDALRNGGSRLRAKVEKKPKPKAEPVEETPLSAPLMETWNHLVANGSSSGDPVETVAREMNIKPATAQYRLRQLHKKGLVHRTNFGYAVGEGPDWGDQPPAI